MTQTLEERQAELEFESVMLGQRRYEQHRAEQGESATLPGKEQTKRALRPLADAIRTFTEQAAAPGKAGRKHSALPYLLHIEPEQAAYLTIRYGIDAAAHYRMAATAAINIGSAIQDHINLLTMGDEAPGLYRKVMEQVKKATSERHRSGVLRHVAQKYDLAKLSWSPREKLLLGTKLLELFEESSGVITLVRHTEGGHDTPVRIKFTPAAEAWFAEAHVRAAEWEPVHQPMIVPPRDWTSPFVGGYLTRAMRTARMVLAHSKGYLDELKHVDMPLVYDAVNAVQRTAWRINKPVLAVMQEARVAGPRYQSLLVEADEPLPPKPAGLPEGVSADSLPPALKEELTAWKARAAKVYELNARRAGERGALAQKLHIASKFKDYERIYFPHYLDFRGRMYPFANYLNPQGDDLARGLLEFAEGRRLGERGAYWLKVHIANLFGVDKVSFEDRIRWVDEHSAQLIQAAASPLDSDFWTQADSPWSALAAIFEYAGWLVQGDDYVSHLPIAMDGSCSGLQHYSAMLRDPVGGAAVNLVPAERPADIYTQVAKRAQSVVDASHMGSELDPWKGGKVVRKIAKQPTMTLCYSATVFGMRGQIETAVRKLSEEKGEPYLGEGVDPYKASVCLANVVWDSIGDTVVAAKNAMAFLKVIATVTASKGLPIRWTAPSGFPVVQEYKEVLGEVVKLHYKGKRVELTITKEGERIDKKRQASGVAPNFVHSLDSSHLMATVNLGVVNGLTSWAVVHDSFGVHAADVDILHAVIREAFIEQYTPDVLQRFRDEIEEQLRAYAPELIEKLPEVPPKGELDLEAVRDARYFFA